MTTLCSIKTNPENGWLPSGKSLFYDAGWWHAERFLEVSNPFTGEVLGEIACAAPSDVSNAVRSAAIGFGQMRALATWKRAQIFRSVAEYVTASSDVFVRMITSETGKPFKAALKEVARCANTLRLCAEECARLSGETIAFDSFTGGERRHGYYVYEPLGVIAAITPYNDPLNLVVHKVGPALAAGNAVILKPDERAPFSALMLVQAFLDAGLPDHAIAVLTGRGEEFGADLVSHPDVSMVSFTGGDAVGQAIAAAAGVKRISMELGANSPVIVLKDCDIEKAARESVSGAFWAAGQNCLGVQRIYVEADIYDAFVERFLAETGKLKVGDPMDPETDVGPMISEVAADRVMTWIEEGGMQGGRLLVGGERSGTLIRPTVLENVPWTARVACCEVFGPVVSLFRVDSLQEAVCEANRSEYAIHAAIFTRSLEAADYAVRELRAAGVMINDSTDYRLDAMPFGGAGKGNLGREGVRFAMREMAHTKVVCFNNRPQ